MTNMTNNLHHTSPRPLCEATPTVRVAFEVDDSAEGTTTEVIQVGAQLIATLERRPGVHSTPDSTLSRLT